MIDNHSLPDGVSVAAGPGSFPQVRVTTACCQAVISCYGAQVTSWNPAHTGPVLWLSRDAAYAPGKAIRGGIPICAPWFGSGLSGSRTPAHGWMRTAMWQLEDVTRDEDDVVVVLSLDGLDVAGGDPILARYTVRCGNDLRTQLSLTSIERATVEAALHTYLAVSDIARITVDGLQGASYVERGADPGERTDTDALRITGEVDRIYDTTADASVVDPGLERVIHVAKENSATTVVWNPGEAKAAALSDVADDDWRDFVCVETANAQHGAVTLEPGETLTFAATVSVVPLST